MSYQGTVKVGPFFKCVNPATKTSVDALGCRTPSCKVAGQPIYTPFCASCGKPPEPIRKMTVSTRKVEPGLLVEQFESDVYLMNGEGWPDELGVDLWGPNRTMGSCVPEEIGYSCVTPEQVTQERWKFLQEFGGVLKRLEDVYGVGNVTIEWGAVRSYW